MHRLLSRSRQTLAVASRGLRRTPVTAALWNDGHRTIAALASTSIAQQRFYANAPSSAATNPPGRASLPPNEKLIADYRDALSKNDWKAVCDAYEELRRARIALDFDAAQELISYFGKQLSTMDMQELRVFKSRVGRFLDPLTRLLHLHCGKNPEAQILHTTWRALISLYSGMLYERSFIETVAKLKATGLPLERDDYHEIVKGMMRMNRFDEGLEEFNQMMNSGNKPNYESFDVYLDLCERMVERKLVVEMDSMSAEDKQNLLSKIDRKFIEEMTNLVVKPKTRSFERRLSQMIFLHGVCGDMERAQEFVDQLSKERAGKEPLPIMVYKRLIQLSKLNGDDERILSSFRDVMEHYPDRLKFLNESLMYVVETAMKAKESDLALAAAQAMIQSVELSKSVDAQSALYYPKLVQLLRLLPDEKAQDLVATLDDAVNAMRSDLNAKEEQQKSNFNFGKTYKRLIDGLRAEDADKVVEALKEIKESGETLKNELVVKKAAQLFEQKQNMAGMEVMVGMMEKVPFTMAKAYFDSLLGRSEPTKLWDLYCDITDKYKYRMNTPAYGAVAQYFIDAHMPERVEKVLSDVEELTRVTENVPPRSIRAPVGAAMYNSLIQLYTRMNETSKAFEVYSKMIRADNPSKACPTAATYNALLMAHLRDWNLPAFEELYQSLRNNCNNDVPRYVEKSQDMDRNAVRDFILQQWDQFQADLKATSESPAADADINIASDEQPAEPTVVRASSCVPSVTPRYVRPNRATENIRLMAYVTANRIEDAINAVKESFTHSPVSTMQPTAPTYEAIAALYLRKFGQDNWAKREVQREYCGRFTELMNGQEINPLNVDQMLATCEKVVAEAIKSGEVLEQEIKAQQ